MKRRDSLRSVAACAAVSLAGCTTGQVGVGPQVTAPSSSHFTLKFAVGTATIATSASGSAVTGLNVVATFRQGNAQNATATNTPTLSGPASFAGFHSITGITPAQLASFAATKQAGGIVTPAPNAFFGTSLGVFGDGLEQLNLVDAVALGTAFPNFFNLFGYDNCNPNGGAPDSASFKYTVAPLAVPPCSPVDAGVTSISYYGGPPAWPSPQGYGLPAGFLGYPLGFIDFDKVAPVAGTYALDVAYSINATATAYAHVGATAKLANLTPLPSFVVPQVTPQSDGSGLVTVNVPIGATEAVILLDDDSCQLNPATGLTTQRYFALLTRQPGAQTLLLSSKLGPPDATGKPTDTFCTAADDALPNASANHSYHVSAVGFDYPAYEASYPQSTTASPVVANAAGQADVTTSVQTTGTYALTNP